MKFTTDEKDNPLVSILMPVYNAEPFLKETLSSIRNQTYSNWELIIVDDMSTDGSYDILQKLAKSDARIRLYRNRENKKIGFTMNRLLSLAEGNFIARTDADDIMLPHRIERQVEFLQNNSNIGIVGGFMIEIDETNTVRAARKVPLVHEEILQNLFTNQTIQNPTLMFVRDRVSQTELFFNENLSPVDDLDFFFRQLNHTYFANIPEYLMAYRKHSTNSSLQNIKQTFALTKKVREMAVKQYRYLPKLKQKLIHIAQNIVVKAFPNNLLYRIFKLWKNTNLKSKKLDINQLHLRAKRDFTISIVMPAYNNGSVIEKNIATLVDFLRKEERQFEVIVVVDGITDNTFEHAMSQIKKIPELSVFGYGNNMGKGYAVRYGISKAQNDYIGFIDSGEDINLYSLKYMLQEINNDEHADIFIGDKNHILSLCNDIPTSRKLYSRAFQTLVHSLINNSLVDTQVGLKLFKRNAAKELFSNLPLHLNRFSFDVEVLMHASQTGLKVRSCPVIVNNENRKSSVQLIDMASMFHDVCTLSYHYNIRKLKNFLLHILVSFKLQKI